MMSMSHDMGEMWRLTLQSSHMTLLHTYVTCTYTVDFSLSCNLQKWPSNFNTFEIKPYIQAPTHTYCTHICSSLVGWDLHSLLLSRVSVPSGRLKICAMGTNALKLNLHSFVTHWGFQFLVVDSRLVGWNESPEIKHSNTKENVIYRNGPAISIPFK